MIRAGLPLPDLSSRQVCRLILNEKGVLHVQRLRLAKHSGFIRL